MGVVPVFRPRVFLHVEVPACAPGDMDLEGHGALLLHRQPASQASLRNGIHRCEAVVGAAAAAVRLKRGPCLGTERLSQEGVVFELPFEACFYYYFFKAK